MIKVNITRHQLCQAHVPPGMMHHEEHITSVVFLPKM